MGFRMLRSAAALAAVLLLAGCVPGDPVVMPEPDPEVTPVFASDEEALAAATEAYAKYLEVFDTAFAAGGVDTHVLDTALVGHQLDVERAALQEASDQGLHSVGTSTFDQVSLQRYDATLEGADIVVVYLCEDLSDVEVLDREGVSLVAPDRRDRSLYEVSFDFVETESVLKVSGKELWSEDPC